MSHLHLMLTKWSIIKVDKHEPTKYLSTSKRQQQKFLSNIVGLNNTTLKFGKLFHLKEKS